MSKLSVKQAYMKTHQPAATRLERGTNWCILHTNYIPEGHGRCNTPLCSKELRLPSVYQGRASDHLGAKASES